MAPGRIAGTVEPTAAIGVAPMKRINGVVITAPPTPTSDANTPEKKPTTKMIALANQSTSPITDRQSWAVRRRRRNHSAK